MKLMGEMLLRGESFDEIVMGNTALVRAMVEAGTQVVTSYPGSPTPEIAAAIQTISPDRRPFYFEFSTNEKVATEVAYGASVNGHLATVFFKSVGLNVAADTFVQLSLMELLGGMVVVLGDDPGANSSQNEQDNRHYAHMAYTPLLEPSSPGEVYLFYKEAAQLSRQMRMPVILRLTTHVCHAKESVHFEARPPFDAKRDPLFTVDHGPYIPLPASVAELKGRALDKLEKVRSFAASSELNTLIDHQNETLGVIAWGLPYLSLMDALAHTTSKPDILKLAIVHPLETGVIVDFLQSHKEVLVLEELDDLVEKEIKAKAYDLGLNTKIIGKVDRHDWIGEYTPDKVKTILHKIWPGMIPDLRPPLPPSEVPDRPPQMCPGCGHRSAFHAIKQALADTDITVADIGCHTLGYLPPYEVGELLMCMGASTGIGSGLSLFNQTRSVLVFMGDSTFFHAGLPGVVNALHNRHNITMIVMENGTTAMTGPSGPCRHRTKFQYDRRKDTDPKGSRRPWCRSHFEVDTYQQKRLTEMVKTAMDVNGFSVVIARHPCMLKFTREQRRKPGFEPRQVQIDQAICSQVHACVAQFGCPTFTRGSDGSVEINPDLCIGGRIVRADLSDRCHRDARQKMISARYRKGS